MYGKLLGLDEVLHPELGRVLADLVGEHVDHPLDRMDGFGHPERAAIGDPAWRLVRVDAVDLDERVVEVVRAGDHVEQPGRELRRVRRGVRIPVIRDRLDLEAGDLAVLRGTQLGVDVVVTGERIGLQVLGAVLDPLDRFADQERGRHGENVARIDRDLAAEPTADVVGLDPDVLLGDRQAGTRGDQREDRPDGMRRLARDVQRELLANGIPVGDATARLDRGHVDARDVDVLGDPDLGRSQRGIGRIPVARLPVPDVVVLLVLAPIRAQHRGVGLECLEGVDDDLQWLVVDHHRLDAIRGRIAVRGDDRGHLLRLVHHRVGREHHLHVAREGRHPVQLVALEVLARDHGEDARDLERLRRVDRLDRGVGVRAADDVQPEHARQHDILDVLALAADEPRVLLALDRMPHAPDFGRGLWLQIGGHQATPSVVSAATTGADSAADSVPAACWMALTMFT